MFLKFNAKKIVPAVMVFGLAATIVFAAHSWGGYHWARKSNPFTLKLGDNVSTTWDSYLSTASSDWSLSSVLDTAIMAGSFRGNCKPTSGRVEVCSKSYGFNGWLGLATVWAKGNHITQGTVKVNDSYFNTSAYNTTGWRSLVMCQEIGHTLGLGHQDEDFYNDPIVPRTCMDYFIPDANEVVHPNDHDYAQLETIYNSHNDSSTTAGQTVVSGNHSDAAEWGRPVKKDGSGRTSVYEKDLGNGQKEFTFVFWTD